MRRCRLRFGRCVGAWESFLRLESLAGLLLLFGDGDPAQVVLASSCNPSLLIKAPFYNPIRKFNAFSAVRASTPKPRIARNATYLYPRIPTIRRPLQRAPQRTLRIPSPQQLLGLLSQRHNVALAHGREGRVEGGGVEVGGGFGVEGVDVDGAPVVV